MVEAPETIEWLHNQNKSVLVDRIGRLERQIAELRADNDKLRRGLMGVAVFANPIVKAGCEIARLQEQVKAQLAETQRAWNERDGEKRGRLAAEAERDRLRETVTRVADLLDSYEDRFSPPHTIAEREIGILDTCANIRMTIAGTHDPSALQKEPQS